MQIKKFQHIAFILSITLVLVNVAWPAMLDYGYYFFYGTLVLVGIPHGAIDHIIHFRSIKPTRIHLILFYGQYLALILIVALAWYFYPIYAFMIFMIISAYHFGQSQLFYLKASSWWKHTIFFSWGSTVLSSLVYFNFDECYRIFHSFDLLNTAAWLTPYFSKVTFLFFLLVTAATMAMLFYRKWITLSQLFFEVILLGLLLFSAYHTTAVFTFSLYFGIWHAFGSLLLEYTSLRDSFHSVISFVWRLIPYTLVAVTMSVVVYYVVGNYFTDISEYMIFIIIISALTLPHLFIMNKLYKSAG